MFPKTLLAVSGALLTLLSAQSAIAQSVLNKSAIDKSVINKSVLEKVAATGVLTAGTSKDAFPFAYADARGQLTGYSIEMLSLIKSQVEKKVKRPVRLELVALAPDDRIPKLRSRSVDIVCDAASFTWERDQAIDFTVSYGITGTRLLAKKGTRSWEPADLAGRKIGALAKTTGEQAIRQAQPKAQIVLLKDRAAGYQALKDGTIDALADDGILLDAWLQKTASSQPSKPSQPSAQPNPQTYEIVGAPFSREGIACMVPENNSAFLDTANYSLIRFMQGLIQQKPFYVQIFDRWFGPQSVTPLTVDLKGLVLDTMQQVLDSKQAIPEREL
ncbi:MAG: amino acid ABC transporter substrate-binding protein [Thermosynechococcaceae cyanobacterium MS004]|nr:amino acid ABC transporter substrate-binding protein [Thermosynechococcaceae cyanobacterium MS004]